MALPGAHERFRSRCLEYLHERAHTERPPAVALVRSGKSTLLTLSEKCALLAALDTALHSDDEGFDPVGKPEGVSWEEFADKDYEAYKHAVGWAAHVDRVKEWLGPEHADDVQRWLEDVEADLQQPQQGPDGLATQ
jgi:hypothetical protein